MERLELTNIQVIGNEIAIAWSDGVESYLSMDYLRRACPCASCGGEPDVMGYVIRPEVIYHASSFLLSSHQKVGGYGWQPVWADGHGSGIFSYQYLRRLSETTS